MTLPEVLSGAGYYCGLVGKWHLGDNLNPQEGFEYWVTMASGLTRSFYNVEVVEDGKIRVEPGYLTDFWTDRAIRFLYWDAQEKGYRIQIELPYQQLHQTKYKFNALISSFVAVRAKNGEAYAFMLSDEMVKVAYRFVLMGRAGHLRVPG